MKLKKRLSNNIYLFKANNRNTRKRCEMYSRLTIKSKSNNKNREIKTFGLRLQIFKTKNGFLLLTLHK